LIDFLISSSLSASRDAVASSNKIIGASFNIALAIDILCFSPPDNVDPPSPTIVSYLLERLSINS
jgi:hypothetical protein